MIVVHGKDQYDRLLVELYTELPDDTVPLPKGVSSGYSLAATYKEDKRPKNQQYHKAKRDAQSNCRGHIHSRTCTVKEGGRGRRWWRRKRK